MRLQRLFLALATAALLAGGGCAAIDAKQREMIFQPSDRLWPRSDQQGMQEVWITHPHRVEADQEGTSHEARLHALWLDGQRADAPVLLYLHGARWNVSGSTARMRRMQSLGFAVLAVDYQGFGQSSKGLPSEASARADAQAAWDWLADQYPNRPRFIFGHSLGGAIAVDLATRVPDVRGLIVEGTFTRIADVARTFKWGWLPFQPFITQPFDSVDKVPQLKAPLLVVHGSADQLIPSSLGQRLYEAAPTPKRWVLVDGATHHNAGAIGLAQYRVALQQLWPAELGQGRSTTADKGRDRN